MPQFSILLNLIYVKEVILCSETKEKGKSEVKLEILALWVFFVFFLT